MTKKNIITLTLIFTIILIISSIILFLFFNQKESNQKMNVNNNKQETKKEEKKKKIPFKWKTEKDEILKISFSYPDNWFINGSPTGTHIDVSCQVCHFDYKNYCKNHECVDGEFSIDHLDKYPIFSYQGDYHKDSLKMIVEKYHKIIGKEEKESFIGNIEELTIDGEKAYRFILQKKSCENDNVCNKNEIYEEIFIFTQHNERKYLINITFNEISQKILSSLKFLD